MAGSQQRYERDRARWQNDAAELERMIAAASGFRGTPEPPDGSGLVLGPGETVLLALRSASLVDVGGTPTGSAGAYSGFSFRIMKGVRCKVAATRGSYLPGPERYQVADVGPVIITSQRMVFQGSTGTREWAFSSLIGIQHDDRRPLTLIHVANGQALGVLYSVAATSAFRFNCSLAIARFHGDVPALQAELQREKEQHEQLRPRPPAAVGSGGTASHVPGAVRVLWSPLLTGSHSWRTRWRVLQAVTVTLAALVIITGVNAGATKTRNTAGAAASDSVGQGSVASASAPAPTLLPVTARSTAATTPPARSNPPAPARTNQPVAAPTSLEAPNAVSSSTHPPQGAPTAPIASIRIATPTTPPTAIPTKLVTPTPVTADLCGAPTNPWGYNFCANGDLVYAPAANVCSYFQCVGNFPKGTGYLVECHDGMYSMSGGGSGACSDHNGVERAVYSGTGPH